MLAVAAFLIFNLSRVSSVHYRFVAPEYIEQKIGRTCHILRGISNSLVSVDKHALACCNVDWEVRMIMQLKRHKAGNFAE